MRKVVLLLLLIWKTGQQMNSQSVGPQVQLSVSMINSSGVAIHWAAPGNIATECTISVSETGKEEYELFILPRNGLIQLQNLTEGLLYTISCVCLDGNTVIRSANVSVKPGTIATQSTYNFTLNDTCDEEVTPTVWGTNILTGAIFGSIGSVLLAFLLLLLYRKMRSVDAQGALIRLPRNNAVNPYIPFEDNGMNVG